MNIPSSWRQSKIGLMAVLSKYKHAQDVTKLQETVDPVTVWISVVIVIK